MEAIPDDEASAADGAEPPEDEAGTEAQCVRAIRSSS